MQAQRPAQKRQPRGDGFVFHVLQDDGDGGMASSGGMEDDPRANWTAGPA